MRAKLILSALLLLAAVPARAEVRAPPGFSVMARPQPDVACIARNVYHEARGEGATGMVAVGEVALNRVREQNVSACAVVYQRVGGHCQFSWACAGRLVPRGDDWDRSLAVAEALMAPRGLPDPTRGATFFSTCGSAPASGLFRTARIGAHCFWRAAVAAVGRSRRPATFALRQDPGQRHGWFLAVAPERDSFLEVAEAPEQHAIGHRNRAIPR